MYASAYRRRCLAVVVRQMHDTMTSSFSSPGVVFIPLQLSIIISRQRIARRRQSVAMVTNRFVGVISAT